MKLAQRRSRMKVVLVSCCILSISMVGGRSAVWAEDMSVWLCKAEGTYMTCSASRSWRPCQDRRLEGIGVASDRTTACMEAERSCTDNLLRTLMLENQQGNASIKSRCAATACELDSIGEPVPRLMSHGY